MVTPWMLPLCAPLRRDSTYHRHSKARSVLRHLFERMQDVQFQEHYNTVVVGAGPAGVMAATYASARGSVLLVDALQLPREKSCAGMLNEYSQAYLAAVAQLPTDLFCTPEWINFRFYDWDRDIRKGTTLRFANIDRKRFDSWLVGMLPSNVTVADATRFVDCTQNPTGVTVHLCPADDANAPAIPVHCDYLIGCDGPRSSVRRRLPVSQLSLYKTLQEFVAHGEHVEPYFDCVYSRFIGDTYGYGYLVPKDDLIIVGSVFFPGSKDCAATHEKAVETFREYYGYGSVTHRREAWTAVQVTSTRDIVGGYGRVLLAGEAGGIMSPSSGEGISFAMNSGKLAGLAVAESLGRKAAEAQHPVNAPAVVKDRREHASAAHTAGSTALAAYRAALKPIRRTIGKRIRYLPILNSNWGKWLGGSSPNFLVDAVAHRI